MEPIIITLILINIIMPLVFRTNELVTENNDRIVFEFNKVFKIVMLISSIIFVIISLVFFVTAQYGGKNDMLIAVIFFVLFALFISFLYLLTRNKKIIYENNSLYVYNIIGKQKIYDIKNIREAIEIPSDGMNLIFKDNKKIKVDTQMTNYSRIKEILDRNSIVYKDKNGNNNPKGW